MAEYRKTSRVKKPIYVSVEERKRNQAIIDAYKNRFPPKKCRAEITYVNETTNIPYVESGRFTDEESCRNYMQSMLNTFNELSGKKWRILDFRIEVDSAVEQKDDVD